jgi:hypothetical protein
VSYCLVLVNTTITPCNTSDGSRILEIMRALEHVLEIWAQVGEDTLLDSIRELGVGKCNILSMLASQ